MQTTYLSGGRTIRLDAVVPSTPGPHPAILLLHGSGGNISFWLDRIAPALARLNIAIFAAHYFESTGTARADLSMFTDGIHVPAWLKTIRDALAHIAGQPGIDPRRIALIGISLGAFLSLALGTEPGQPIRAIVDISGGLVAPWDKRTTSSFPPTLILHGDADSVVPVSQAHILDVALTSLNVPHTTHILHGEGHWFGPGAQFQMLAATAEFLGKYL